MMELSIIIPVYNVEKYIARCLDSIYALPIKAEQFEVLCIDDCSPDGSCVIIEEYQKRHANLRLIHHNENLRQGGARNTGIRETKGEYCMFVDADDSLPQFDILAQIDYMRKNELELLLGRANVIGADGTISKWGNSPDVESAIMAGPDIYVDEYVHKVAFGVVWMGFYKTELVRRTAPFLEKVQYEDTDWCFKCTYNAKRVQYKPFDMYLYHNNPTSSSHNVNAQKLEWKVRLSQRVYEWAQTVTEEREAVQFAAEDFYTWNLRGLGILWRFSLTERRKFFTAFSSEDYRMFQSWPLFYKQMYALKYPRLTQVFLFFFAPFMQLARRIKHMFH